MFALTELTFVKLLLAQVNVNEERTVHVNCTVSPGMGLKASGRSNISNDSSTAAACGQRGIHSVQQKRGRGSLCKQTSYAPLCHVTL